MKVGRLCARLDDGLGKRFAAVAAVCEHLGQRKAAARVRTEIGQNLQLPVAVRFKAIDRHDNRHAVFLHIFDMRRQVDKPAPQRRLVRARCFGLGHAAVIFERAHRRDQHNRRRRKPRAAAFDIHKLFSSEVRTEAGLCNHIIGQLERELCRAHGVAAVRDICERAAMHKRRSIFKRLNKVRLERVFKKRGHRAVRLQIAGIDRLLVEGVGHKDVAKTFFQIGQVSGETEDCHYLGRDRNHKAILARHAIDAAAKSYDNIAQRAVVHIHTALDQDPALVDPKCVALLEMIVQQGAEQVVGGGDRMHIASKMKIDVLHRDHLRIAAAGCAALDAEHRAERRLAQRNDSVFADLLHRLSKSNGRCRFAFAGRGGIDGCNKHKLAVRPLGKPRKDGFRKLGFKAAIRLQFLRQNAETAGDLSNRQHRGCLCDFNVRFHAILPFKAEPAANILLEASNCR